MLSNKSDEEIGWMLDDYGIKHGPVVGSTRSLYEKKLRDVTAKERRNKPASDIRFYKEEQAEVSYVQQRRPLREEGSGDRRWAASRFEYRDEDAIDEPIVYRTPYRESDRVPYHSPAQERRPVQKDRGHTPSSSPFVPLWIQILLFLVVLGILAFIFINMEPAESFKRLT